MIRPFLQVSVVDEGGRCAWNVNEARVNVIHEDNDCRGGS